MVCSKPDYFHWVEVILHTWPKKHRFVWIDTWRRGDNSLLTRIWRGRRSQGRFQMNQEAAAMWDSCNPGIEALLLVANRLSLHPGCHPERSHWARPLCQGSGLPGFKWHCCCHIHVCQVHVIQVYEVGKRMWDNFQDLPGCTCMIYDYAGVYKQNTYFFKDTFLVNGWGYLAACSWQKPGPGWGARGHGRWGCPKSAGASNPLVWSEFCLETFFSQTCGFSILCQKPRVWSSWRYLATCRCGLIMALVGRRLDSVQRRFQQAQFRVAWVLIHQETNGFQPPSLRVETWLPLKIPNGMMKTWRGN